MRRREILVLLAVGLDLAGFGMVFPDIQTRAESYLHGRDSPGLWIGALLATSFIVQLLASPRWGRVSDRLGRGPIFVICQLLSGAGLLIYGLAANYPILVLSRVVSGLGSANVAVAQAWASDQVEGKAGRLGRMAAAISTGLVAGPAAGGFLAHYGGNLLVGCVGASLSLTGAALGYLGMRGAPLPSRSQPAEPPRKRRVLDLSLLKRFPEVEPLLVIAVIGSFSLATLEGTFGRLIKRLLGFGEREFGIVFAYESLLGALVGGILLASLARRFRERSLLRTAFLLQGVGLALNPIAGPLQPYLPGMAVLLFASTLYAVGAGVANPTLAAAVSRLVPESVQGELFGLLQVARNFGFVVGPILGGRLFDWEPAAPYVFAGVVSVMTAFFIPKSRGAQEG